MSASPVPDDRAGVPGEGGPGESGPAYRPPTGWLAGAGSALPYPTPEPSGETTRGAAGRPGRATARPDGADTGGHDPDRIGRVGFGHPDETDPGADPDPDESEDEDLRGLGIDPDTLGDDALLAPERPWQPTDVADIDITDLPTRPPGDLTAHPEAGRPKTDRPAAGRPGTGRPAGRPGTGDPPRAVGVDPASLGSWDRRFEPGWPPPEPCPHCGTRRLLSDLYCLGCRYEFATGRRPTAPSTRQLPATGPAWKAVVEVDPVHFRTLIGRDLRLPSDRPAHVVPLESPEILIGARSNHPEPGINLTGRFDDPAVSGRHASLVQQPDGSYSVVDHGSRNGTRVNGNPEPIRPGCPVPLRDGDRVFVGAWTRITLRLR